MKDWKKPRTSSTEQQKKKEEKVDIAKLLAMGDLAHGEKVFKKCSACHMIASDGKNMIGPNLWGVIGRTAGSVNDYKYSKAMVAYGKEWSFEEMNSYLIKPQAYIKGTKMAFAGLRKEKDRASVILYMNSKGKAQNLYLNLNTILLYFFEHALYLMLASKQLIVFHQLLHL